MDSIVTQELPLQPPQREPTDEEVEAARDQIAHLEAEARGPGADSGCRPGASRDGRIFIEQLGDASSAATCYQNACLVDPQYRPALEAARRLFASVGRYEQALALHQREESLLEHGDHRAESLRAQALLLRSLGRVEDANRVIDDALQLAPDHPALLKSRVQAAERDGDRALTASLLVRSAGATRDPVYKATLLRRAVLILEALGAGSAQRRRPGTRRQGRLIWWRCTRRPRASSGWRTPTIRSGSRPCCCGRAPANDWEGVLRLCRQRAERTASPGGPGPGRRRRGVPAREGVEGWRR